VTMGMEHIISMYSLEPLMTDPNVCDLSVFKALSSLIM
jgi:hypothetical protein